MRVVADRTALAEEGAKLFKVSADEAKARGGTFRVALAGGNTPRPVYEKLASELYRREVDWTSVQVFFSDERFVPPDSPESNYRMVQEALLSHVEIPEGFVHPVATVDVSPEESARLYEEGVRRVLAAGLAEVPRFDLILLGLGPDGHTASLFPGTEALAVADHIVAASYVPKLYSWRVTFTYPLLNAAARVVFLVEGAEKADILSRVLAGNTEFPASRVRPENGELIWLVDRSAASKLPEKSREL